MLVHAVGCGGEDCSELGGVIFDADRFRIGSDLRNPLVGRDGLRFKRNSLLDCVRYCIVSPSQPGGVMFNSLTYAKQLEEVGVSPKQAEVHMQIMSDLLESKLAMKDDIEKMDAKFDTKLARLETRLFRNLTAMTAVLLTVAVALNKFLN